MVLVSLHNPKFNSTSINSSISCNGGPNPLGPRILTTQVQVSQSHSPIIKEHWGSRSVKDLGPVSQKSRNFTGYLRVSQFGLYLKNGEDLSRQTSQSFFFLSLWKYVKRSAFQNKRLTVSQMAFRARKVFGTFEKRASVFETRKEAC